MTKEDLFDMAQNYYSILKRNNHFFDNYPSFIMRDIPNERTKHILVHVKDDLIKEIVVYYNDGNWETLRS